MNNRLKGRVWYPIYPCGDGEPRMEYFEVFLGVEFFLDDHNDAVIMMCTGLKDCNRKLIYENDILSYNDRKLLVKWSDESASFYGSRSPFIFYNIEDAFNPFIPPPAFERWEIVGNEFEHPELLK